MDLHYLQDICHDETPCKSVAAKLSSGICSMSDYFRQRYCKIHTAVELPCSKPKMMNYLNMAMVWVEIMLYKEVDWSIIYGKNVNLLCWDIWMIPTN
jgi:hypothetical protein